jgi:hypothetical protein
LIYLYIIAPFGASKVHKKFQFFEKSVNFFIVLVFTLKMPIGGIIRNEWKSDYENNIIALRKFREEFL